MAQNEKSFTYKLCEKIITAKRTDCMQEKLDVFFANNRLSNNEYTELCKMLTAEKEV